MRWKTFTGGTMAVMVLCTILGFAGLSQKTHADQFTTEGTYPAIRPQDRQVVAVNPPGFAWAAQPQAQSYTLQLAAQPDFAKIDHEYNSISYSLFCPDQPLKPGKWHWRVGAMTAGASVWSETRVLYVPEGAVAFPLPKMQDLLKKIPTNHPKMLVRPEDKKTFIQSLQTNYPDLASSFLINADRWLAQPVVQTTTLLPSVLEGMETSTNLAFAYFLSDRSVYGNKCREWLLALSTWPADGVASASSDLATAARILSRGARSYTFAYPVLSEADRATILAAFTQRGQALFEALQTGLGTNTPFDPDFEFAWQALGEAGIVFSKEIPQGPTWLQYALTIFHTLSPMSGDAEGGWHGGIANWNAVIDEQVWWLDILRSSFGIDGYKLPFFTQTGDFALYTNPPGTTHGGFGQGAETHDAARNGILMGRLASQTRNPFWLWYAILSTPQLQPADITYKEVLRAETPDFEGVIPSDLPPSKVFRGTGIAALHSRLEFPEGDSYLLFKSSPQGTSPLANDAQNAFTLSCNQETVLAGFGDGADQILTIDGQGQQAPSPEARGRMIHEFFGDNLDYIAGDATEAYDGRLKQWVRHILFVKPNTLFMIDEVETPEPASVEFHLYAKEPFAITDQYKIEATNEAAGVRIAFASPSNLVIKQVTESLPNQGTRWHLQATPQEKSSKTSFVTAYLPHHINATPNINATFHELNGNELYGIQLDLWNIGLVIRRNQEIIDLGMIQTDASILLIQRRNTGDGAANMLAANATYFDFQGQRLAESKTPAALFIPKEWLAVEMPAEADIPASATEPTGADPEKVGE
ncbi:MAG: DUF4962 domain-containing protein [bacterium]|jgi:hypothetical protein|nr:DUF4962 domain-containing protein [bacterium]